LMLYGIYHHMAWRDGISDRFALYRFESAFEIRKERI
jgi:hypothetical protein